MIALWISFCAAVTVLLTVLVLTIVCVVVIRTLVSFL
jgi:hypothetical protein